MDCGNSRGFAGNCAAGSVAVNDVCDKQALEEEQSGPRLFDFVEHG
jgi:hypothetical protein